MGITVPKYLFYGLILALVSIVILFFFAMNDGNRCLSDPLVYGVQKAQNDDTGPVTCSCDFSNPSYNTLFFDVNGMSTENTLFTNISYID